ncbi:hypothetical protein [Qipengyuania nanhaisediminis]|uniref:hypothetical protein n=1 Tax=Qipengyuania nanhaisediminis TaxID=604088 RepID=UPI0038B2C41B
MPTIALSNIPGLETAQALYGAVSNQVGVYDDSTVAVMVYVYNVAPAVTAGVA